MDNVRIDVEYRCPDFENCGDMVVKSVEITELQACLLADIVGTEVDAIAGVVVEASCGGCRLTALENFVAVGSWMDKDEQERRLTDLRNR